MLAQCGGGRQTEDEVDIIGAAPVDDLRTTIMAVGPDQDRGVRLVAADRPHQAAQVGADFCPARPPGRPQHRTAEAAIAIEHHDRLEAIFVVMMRWNGPLPQHQSAKTWSFIQRHKIEPFREAYYHYRAGFGQASFSDPSADVEGTPIVSRKLRRATDFAISRPIVVTLSIVALLQLWPTIITARANNRCVRQPQYALSKVGQYETDPVDRKTGFGRGDQNVEQP